MKVRDLQAVLSRIEPDAEAFLYDEKSAAWMPVTSCVYVKDGYVVRRDSDGRIHRLVMESSDGAKVVSPPGYTPVNEPSVVIQ